MNPPSDNRTVDAFRRVLGTYEAFGLDTNAIRQLSIAEFDGELLVEFVREQRPKRILEVGTYVGVSTFLMALADPAAAIISIDPSLPLAVQTGRMDIGLGSLASVVRTHDVARAVAHHLGVDARIQFVKGGFSIGDAFSSVGRRYSARVPVVGPAVCDVYGPFDLIFLDGLHNASAVEPDLRLAAEALTDNGVILVRGCIRMWSGDLGVGILRFLADRAEFRLSHPAFNELDSSIGMVFRADARL
jgi:predicted O-methyltransferase YrrM